MKIHRTIAVGLLAAFLLSPAIATAADLKPGAEAPAIELPEFNAAAPFSLESFKGKQAVIFEFSQSACGGCKSMTEFLKGFHGKSKAYEIVMVNVDLKAGSDKWKEGMKTIVEAEGIPMRILMDPKFTVGPKFGIRATPALVVIDKDGKFVGSLVGFDESMRGDYKELIEKAK